MKKFILFFRGGTGTNNTKSWSSWVEELKQKTVFVDGAPLTQNGKIVSGSGETSSDFIFDINDNARGFLIINAKNLNGALELSKDCPIFLEGGNITIRPIEERY